METNYDTPRPDEESKKEWHRRVPWDPILEAVEGEKIPAALSAFLEHNYAPEEYQVDFVRKFRARCSERLHAIQDEIERLGGIETCKIKHKELEAEVYLRRKEIFACDVALSPLRRLPFDVLQEIALWCLPEAPNGQTCDAPLSLSWVSSMWRKAVLCLAKAWCELHIHAGPGFRWRKLARFMTEYFTRAQGHPLSLSLSMHVEKKYQLETSSIVSEGKQLVNWVMLQSDLVRRIKYISIASNFSMFSITTLENRPDLPMLECLVIEEYDTPPSSDASWLANVLLQAPRLKRWAIWVAIESHTAQRFIQAPWWQLTHLSLDPVLPAAHWIALLDKCINLKYGEFCVSDQPSNSAIPTQLTEHKSLRNLIINFRDILPTSFGILRYRSFPVVSHLKIIFNERVKYDEPLQPPFFLEANFPNLHTVSLYLGSSPPLPYIEFFTENPQITALCIEMEARQCLPLCHSLAIRGLRKAERDVPLPNLASLIIKVLSNSVRRSGRNLFRGRALEILAMIRSRVLGVEAKVTPLSFCRLMVCAQESIAHEMEARLEILRMRSSFSYEFKKLPDAIPITELAEHFLPSK